MADEPKLEEQVISQVVESGLSSQLDQAENLSVDIKTDLLNVVQGKVNSVAIKGKGLVAQHDLRVEEIQLKTGHIAINPLSVLLGQVQPEHPIDSEVRLVFTEADLNQALNSNFIIRQLSNWELDVQGKTVSISLQPPFEMRLPEKNKMELKAGILLPEEQETRWIELTIVVHLQLPGQVRLETLHCHSGQSISLELAIAILPKIEAIAKHPYLVWEGSTFYINSLEIEPGRLILQTQAHLEKLPIKN